MNKDTLNYLANLAIVKQHISNVCNFPHSILSKENRKLISAKGSELDRLFIDILVGKENVSCSLQDLASLSKKLIEEPVLEQCITENPQEIQELVLEQYEVEKPQEEVEEFNKILQDAERQVKNTKRTRKKNV